MITATLDFMRDAENNEAREPVDLAAQLQEIRADASVLGWKVSVQARPGEPYRAQRSALRRCLTNLVENAVKYGGEAHVELEDGPDAACIRVRDRGPGIPEPLLEKVFEPFYRIESSRNRHTGGVGLGLAIARAAARAHGGTLTLRNLPQGGLEACLVLPRS
jgi:protein-histidine pros-kinase